MFFSPHLNMLLRMHRCIGTLATCTNGAVTRLLQPRLFSAPASSMIRSMKRPMH